MSVTTRRIYLNTKGSGDLLNITDRLQTALDEAGIKEGLLNVFVIGSTAALTTFEFEDGLIADMGELYERIAPVGRHYAHDDTWGDANGFSHVRAALQGPGLALPVENGRLLLGTWQQVVLAEFDNQARKRELILTFIGG